MSPAVQPPAAQPPFTQPEAAPVGGAPSPLKGRRAWWVVGLALFGLALSMVATFVCAVQWQTTIWLPPGADGTSNPRQLTNSAMVAWSVTAAVCALAYLVAAVLVFTRGLSRRSWLPLVCLLFPALTALWAGFSFRSPVG